METTIEEEQMRSEAMERLDVLTGSWRTTLCNAWFIDPPGQEFHGSTTIEWIGQAFVLVRWTMDDGEQTLVLGRSDAQDAYTALYHDERGVCRVFAMTFDGTHWILTREDPDMHQRFIAEIGPDRIDGRWEASEDQGATWRKDFDLIFTRT